MRRDRIMNGTQAFEFLGNGGLWGFDRRYVGLDIRLLVGVTNRYNLT
ncbi:hypothetical protein ALQ57_200024 [Pseudomonas amygdali pv. hibisci]|nr:hypothetical protein ALQ57_200024 [Pseudomonas amygdali pv. hibisci]